MSDLRFSCSPRFASTIDTMSILEHLVRKSFADMYFGDKTYINIMHNNFISQIKSFNSVLTDDKGNEYVIINDERVEIPKIPKSILDNFEKNLTILRSAVINSPYMIN